MYEWQRQIQQIVEEIDYCIEGYNDEALTLRRLARKMGYSEFYATRKFKEISGMSFRDYLRQRKLAFALKEVRDKQKSFLVSPLIMVFPRMKPLPVHLKGCMESLPVSIAGSRSRWYFEPESAHLTATF